MPDRGGGRAGTKNLADLQRERLEALLEEGYRAAQSESLALAREFESVDIEGWSPTSEYWIRRQSP
ncbi:MAG: hypothetical protein NTU41_03930, partial [Chloroflexi bacterium]|nr:hypothetical protein [Chloroflexota bacterium]